MKKLLSVFIVLCMMIAMLPLSAMAEETDMPMEETPVVITDFVPLAETEPIGDYVAKIGETGYTTLQEAVDAVEADVEDKQIIRLVNDS